jgi:plasmid stabilization system protein ParE
VRVVWSPLADQQVDEAVEYIAQDDPAAALEWLDHLLERVKTLASFRIRDAWSRRLSARTPARSSSVRIR